MTKSPTPSIAVKTPAQAPLSGVAADLALARVVFPVRPRDKQPLCKWGALTPGPDLADWIRQLRTWRRPGVGIGMRTGAGLAVIDLDPRHRADRDQDPEDWLADNLAELPATLTVRTPGRGAHCYFSTTARLRSRAPITTGMDGIDIRAEGGFVIVPPSPGYSYVDPDAPIAPLPDWLERAAEHQPTRDSGGAMPPDWRPYEIPDHLAAGERNSGLARLAGWLLSQDIAGPDDLEDWLQDFNVQLCDGDPLAEDEVAAIAASVGRYGS